MEPLDRPCEPDIRRADLPKRTAQTLERERSLWHPMARRLVQGPGERGDGAEAVTVTARTLLGHLDVDADDAEAAAFLAGRCTVGDEATDGKLTAALAALVESSAEGPARTEAAMALALSGRADEGRAALRDLAASTSPFDESYRAAAYLVQFDDPSGFPAVQRAVAGEIGHFKIMALRTVTLWEPYDGRELDSTTIDVGAVVRSCAEDEDALVRREVPAQLEHLALPDRRALLEKLARDPDSGVQSAAKEALERVGG